MTMYALITYSSLLLVPTDILLWLSLIEENKIPDYCGFVCQDWHIPFNHWCFKISNIKAFLVGSVVSKVKRRSPVGNLLCPVVFIVLDVKEQLPSYRGSIHMTYGLWHDASFCIMIRWRIIWDVLIFILFCKNGGHRPVSVSVVCPATEVY